MMAIMMYMVQILTCASEQLLQLAGSGLSLRLSSVNITVTLGQRLERSNAMSFQIAVHAKANG